MRPINTLVIVPLLFFSISSCAPPRPTDSPNSISLIYGDLGGAGNLDGRGSDARFAHIRVGAIDNDGAVWITDKGYEKGYFRKIDTAGTVETVPVADWFPNLRPNAFSDVGGMQFARDGALWLAEERLNTIYRSMPGAAAQRLAGSPGKRGFQNGADSFLSAPQSLSVSEDGKVAFFIDARNYAIRQVDINGRTSTVYRGAGIDYDWDSEEESRRTTARPNPEVVIAHTDGHLYVIGRYTDATEGLKRYHPIVKIDRKGNELARWVGESAFSRANTRNAQQPILRNPDALAESADGTLWITQTDGSILTLDIHGTLATFAEPRCRNMDGCEGGNRDDHEHYRSLSVLHNPAGLPMFYSTFAVFKLDRNNVIRPLAGNDLCIGRASQNNVWQCGYIGAMLPMHNGHFWVYDHSALREIDDAGRVVHEESKHLKIQWHDKFLQCEHDPADKLHEDKEPQIKFMAQAPNGTRYAAFYGGAILRISPDGERRLIVQGYRDRAPCTTDTATLSSVNGMVATDDAIYVADDKHRAAFRIDATSLEVRKLTTEPNPDYGMPNAIAVDNEENVYLGDLKGISRITADGGLALIADLSAYGGECGSIWPQFLSVDRNGDFWFASEHGSNQIYKWNVSTQRLQVIVGSERYQGNRLGPLPGSLGEISAFYRRGDRLYLSAAAAILVAHYADNDALTTDLAKSSARQGGCDSST